MNKALPKKILNILLVLLTFIGGVPAIGIANLPSQAVGTTNLPSQAVSHQEATVYEKSLEYHRLTPTGKISVQSSKPLKNQHDLSLAYTPGVAAASNLIAKDPNEAFNLTARSNLVAVISNGTAVLGLGNIGALAAKPVMEGKAVLFKKFAGIDCFDIEINEQDPDKLIDIIAALEPTFGAINLEDIKAPECFYIEAKLKERLKIPVLHDDQHGTAIVVSAAILNGLKLAGKEISKVKMVVSGAGAAGIASLNLLTKLGLNKDQLIVIDSKGVIYQGRPGNLESSKAQYAAKTSYRTLEQAIQNADVFLGLSAPKVLTPEMVKTMAKNPLILALANPEPEILPELVYKVRPDAIVATGRSDYPNQVNNALAFPYLFRAALDMGAPSFNTEMELAAVKAIAEHAEKATDNSILKSAYGDKHFTFGREYILPKLLDPRLLLVVTPKIAEAAITSGIATRPQIDIELYKKQLMARVVD